MKAHLLLEDDNGMLSVIINGEHLPLFADTGDGDVPFQIRVGKIEEHFTGRDAEGYTDQRISYGDARYIADIDTIIHDLEADGMKKKEIKELDIRQERCFMVG